MKMLVKLAAAAALSASILAPTAAIAQTATPRAIVSLYHAATGHQEALMRWLADQDRVSTSIGLPPGQVYVHTDGDSWDFMIIYPVTTAAQDAAFDAAAKKMGIATGPRAGLEFRKHIQTHSDTFTNGPMTAAQYLASLGPEH